MTKRHTRTFLIQGLHQNLVTMQENQLKGDVKTKLYFQKKVENLLIFINKLHDNDGFQLWGSLYQQLLTSGQLNSNSNSFWVLRILRPADDRVHFFTRILFLLTVQQKVIFGKEETFQIFYHSVRSMGHLVGVDDQFLNQSINPHLDGLVKYIIAGAKTSLRCMRTSLRILVVLISDFEVNPNPSTIQFLTSLGSQISTQRLAQLFLSTSQLSFSQVPLQLQQDQPQQQATPSVQLLFYQYLALIQTLIEIHQKQSIPNNIVFWLVSVALIPDQKTVNYWCKQQDQYVADVEDQSKRSLRNKGIEMLSRLFEGQYSESAKQFFQGYFKVLLQGASMGKQEFFRNMTKFNGHYKLPLNSQTHLLPHYLYQQSCYFTLYSFTSEMMPSKEHKSSMMGFLMSKIQTQKSGESNQACILVKIMALTIVNKLAKQVIASGSPDEANYLKYLIKIAGLELKNAGIVLNVCRGLGALCYRRDIEVDKQNGIPLQLVSQFLQYVCGPAKLIAVDSSHIIFQTLIKLVQGKKIIHQQNRKLMKQCLNRERWWIIIKTYMHDGMAASLIGKLLLLIATDQIINEIWEGIKTNSVSTRNYQAFYQLIANSVESNRITIGEQQLQLLLLTHSKNPQLLARLVKSQLTHTNPLQLSPQTVNLLNQSLQPLWLLPMLSLNLLTSPQKTLLSMVHRIVDQITSQHQLENHLLLPYYFLLKDCRQTLRLLANQNLYHPFIEKLIKYAKLFRGDALKNVTSWVLIKVVELDTQWKGKAVEVVNGFGQMRCQEWVDQEQDQEQEDVIERMFNLRIVNQEVEQLMQSAFPEFVWNTEAVSMAIGALSQ